MHVNTGNIINAQLDLTARKLIGNVERVLLKYNKLERYDVYCEWWNNEPNSYKIWLRDRLDDSRIGPFNAEDFTKNSRLIIAKLEVKLEQKRYKK